MLTLGRPTVRPQMRMAMPVVAAAAAEAPTEAVAHLRYQRGSPLKVKIKILR